ncbi:hypothetical protein MLD38_036100 [Melastoma candidum]|uniref:Uncharacterized protein n=1 Tax=Melastoma candidum TaxID=119954 RepID=A0ACB9LJU8_9MYRT|nr:hypothetical protein MLD38_036100 [Melastoma candidum]
MSQILFKSSSAYSYTQLVLLTTPLKLRLKFNPTSRRPALLSSTLAFLSPSHQKPFSPPSALQRLSRLASNSIAHVAEDSRGNPKVVEDGGRMKWVSRTRFCGELSDGDVGKRVRLCGWVALHRVHGGLTFFNLRDHTGIVQITTLPNEFQHAHSIINDLRLEYVVSVEGSIRFRPAESINKRMKTGTIEIAAERVQILNSVRSKLPLLVTSGDDVSDTMKEEIRLMSNIVKDQSALSKNLCAAYLCKLCDEGTLASRTRLLQFIHDNDMVLGQKVYENLLKTAAKRGDLALTCGIFKHLLRVARDSLSSAILLEVAKAFAKESDRFQLLGFVKEVSESAFPKSTPIINRIIYAFADCGQVDKAILIFDYIGNLKCKPDLVTYNIVLDALGRAGRIDELLHTFALMKEASVVPDVISYNTLINGLRKMGRLDTCLMILREMEERCVAPDLLTYTALIECFGRTGNIDVSLRLLREMKQKQIRPSVYIYRSLISNLKRMGKVELAMEMFNELKSSDVELSRPEDFKRNNR